MKRLTAASKISEKTNKAILLCLFCFISVFILINFVLMNPIKAHAADTGYSISVLSEELYFVTTVEPEVQHNLPNGTVLFYQWYEVIGEGIVPIAGANGSKFTTDREIILRLTVTAEVDGEVISGFSYMGIFLNAYKLLFLSGDGGQTYKTGLGRIGEPVVLPDSGSVADLLGWSKNRNSAVAEYAPDESAVFDADDIVNNTVILYAVCDIADPVFTYTAVPVIGRYYTITVICSHSDNTAVFSFEWYFYDESEQKYVKYNTQSTGNTLTTEYFGYYMAEVTTIINGIPRKVTKTDDINAGSSNTMCTVTYLSQNGAVIYKQKVFAGHGLRIYSGDNKMQVTGYNFIGWGYIGGTQVNFTPGQADVSFLTNVTLYANYRLINPEVSLSGNLDGVRYRTEGYNIVSTATHPLIGVKETECYYEWYKYNEESQEFVLIEGADKSYYTVYSDEDDGVYKVHFKIVHNGYVGDAKSSDNITVSIIMPTVLTLRYWIPDGKVLLHTETAYEWYPYTLVSEVYQKTGYVHIGWSLTSNNLAADYGLGETIASAEREYKFYAVMRILPPEPKEEIRGIDYTYTGTPTVQTLLANMNVIDDLTYSYQWYKKNPANEFIKIENAVYKLITMNGENDSGVYRVVVTVSDGRQSASWTSGEVAVSIRSLDKKPELPPETKEKSLLWLWITLGCVGGAALLATGGLFLFKFIKFKKKK